MSDAARADAAPVGPRGVFGPAPDTLPTLGPGDAHLWLVELTADTDRLARCRALLSSDERARADRFHFERHRRRFSVARASLRRLLGRYVGADPGALAFLYGARGKPRLAQPTELEFNLSHSHELALVGVTRGIPLGIDVEWLRSLGGFGGAANASTGAHDVAAGHGCEAGQAADSDRRDTDEGEVLARRFFSEPEVTALLSLPVEQRSRAFFACWTRKEAYVKAVGDGLAMGLHRFAVSLLPGEPARVLAWPGGRPGGAEGQRLDQSAWFLHDLDVGPGYAAALALAGEDRQLSCWRLAPS